MVEDNPFASLGNAKVPLKDRTEPNAAEQEGLSMVEAETNKGPFEEIKEFLEQIPEGRGEKLLDFMNPFNKGATLATKMEWVSTFANKGEFLAAAKDTVLGRMTTAGGGSTETAAKRAQYSKIAGYMGKLFEDRGLFGKK